jgi:heme-degrading monooxygenase HmoA
VNGEWGFYLILDEFLKSAVESRRAAAGWAGDRTSVYETQKGEVLYISLSTWDTENDAREFFDAYVKRTQLRYPTATTSTDSQQSVTDLQAFRTPEGVTAIELRGSRVLIIDGASGEPGIDALLKALRQGN